MRNDILNRKMACRLLLFTLAVLIVGCSSQLAKNIRSVTYPPNFKYVEASQLRSSMDRLAQHMRRLDIALSAKMILSDQDVEAQRLEVLSELADIERIASSLKADDAGSSHPFLEDHMTDFVNRVGDARVAASLPQPRYYLAGKISGGCINCHRVNR